MNAVTFDLSLCASKARNWVETVRQENGLAVNGAASTIWSHVDRSTIAPLTLGHCPTRGKEWSVGNAPELRPMALATCGCGRLVVN